jgi:hypothetical protein
MNTDRYGNEVLSDYFYSNCLIEAIKAKLRNPKVKIQRYRMKWTRIPHFTWRNGGYDYDFGANESIPSKLFFRGYLRRKKYKEATDHA